MEQFIRIKIVDFETHSVAELLTTLETIESLKTIPSLRIVEENTLSVEEEFFEQI